MRGSSVSPQLTPMRVEPQSVTAGRRSDPSEAARRSTSAHAATTAEPAAARVEVAHGPAGPRLVDDQLAVAEVATVERGDGRIGLVVARHLDQREPARLAG